MQLFMHTTKAVNRGEPADRLFLVVGRHGKDMLAWKCTVTPKGIKHPAFKELLKPSELEAKGMLLKGANNSEPTALFKPDSLYRQVFLNDLDKMINN
jgi:hypothetical protein